MSTSRHLRALLLGSALVLPVCSQPQSKIAVVAVRFWSLGDTTRVVVETTGEFEFRVDRAEQPSRLFFDVRGAHMRLPKRGLNVYSVSDKFVKQIRVAETQPNVTRVVFDLESSVDYAASQLTNPDRLVVELRAAGTRQTVPEMPLATPPSLPVSSVPLRPGPLPAARPNAIPPPTEPVRMATLPPEKAVAIPGPVMPRQTPPAVETNPVNVAGIAEPTRSRERVEAALRVPKPARLPGNGESSSLTRVLGLKINRIVLDAGHGGHDSGTAGPGGMLEKDLVLDIAKRLGALIETKMGSQVIYTRSDDTFVPLELRTQVANEHKADLFLSIHANSSPARNASGVETYYLNFTTSEDSLEVAARENASSVKTVYELKDLLQKIAMQDKVGESREFAGKVQSGLYGVSLKANSKTRNRGVKKAPFVVLIGASMPSILAEIGFVSNPKDEALFKRAEYRQKIAEGLFRGISQYASGLSHFQVAQK